MGAVPRPDARTPRRVLLTEANAVSDNPLVFADTRTRSCRAAISTREPVAFAADNLALAIAEIGALSERRIALLMDTNLSGPAAVPGRGRRRQLRLHDRAGDGRRARVREQVARASRVSVDSLPTSANQEDHVSMATYAARRLLPMAGNTSAIVAIELLAAAQGIDLRRPLATSPPLRTRARARARVPRRSGTRDRAFAPDLAAMRAQVERGEFVTTFPRRSAPLTQADKSAAVDAAEATMVATIRTRSPGSAADTRHADRVIRAPRGTQLTAEVWLTEAPLRMLHEQPRPRRRREPEGARRLRRHRPRRAQLGLLRRDRRGADGARRRRVAADPVGQAGGRVQDASPTRRACSSPTRTSCRDWATWEHFNELDRKGLMMFGQMTAGSWIYIGSQGIVQGTYETFAEAGRQHYGGDLERQVDPDRGPGRHGRRAAARRDDGRRVDARDRVPAVAHRDAASRRATSTCRRATSTTRSRLIDAGAARQRKPVSDRPARQRRRDPAGARARAACGPHMVTDQTSAHDLVYGYLPAGWTRRALARGAGRSGAARRARRGRAAHRSQRTCEAMLALPRAGHSHVRLRQQHPPGRVRRGRRRRVRVPRLRARVHPAAVLRRQGPVPLGRAVRRSRGHPRDRPQGQGAVPRQRAPASLARHGGRAHRVPGPARAHLLARVSASAIAPAWRSTRWSRAAS